MVFTNANVTLGLRAQVSIVTILMNANKELAISTTLLELERLATSVIIMKIASITVVAINVNVKRDFMEKPATTLTNAQEGFQTGCYESLCWSKYQRTISYGFTNILNQHWKILQTSTHANSKGQFQNQFKKELTCAICKQTAQIPSVRLFQ